MDISLFERMIKIHPQNLIQLTVQYRMHPKIIEYSSRKFYNNTLINSYQVRNNGRVNINFNQNFRWFNNDIPIMFIHIDERENLSSSGCSWENEKEANLVCQIVRKIINCDINPNDIGIITPYLAQRELIEDKLFNYNINNILISSVDSFQGQEKDFIIVSTVRSNLSDRIGFIEDPRRLNVTLTRAKYGLIFIGNAKCLSNSKDHNGDFTIWRNLIKYYQDIKVLCCYNNDNFSPIDNIVQDDFNWNYIPEFNWDQFYDNHYQYRGNYRNNFRYRGNNNYYYRRNGYMSGRRYY
jgi:regulator of nonsense transcripts 1